LARRRRRGTWALIPFLIDFKDRSSTSKRPWPRANFQRRTLNVQSIQFRHMRVVVAIFFLLSFCGACDQPPVPTEDLPTTAPAHKSYAANVSIVTPLLPRRAVHVAVDPPGNLWFVQESDNGDDVTFIAGASEAPRATRLTSANILAAVGASADDNGNIQSIAAGANGEIYFYLKG